MDVISEVVMSSSIFWVVPGSVLSVTCNNVQAELHIPNFLSGSIGRCIRDNDYWLTPEEFEAKSGMALHDDWMSSIRCGPNTLRDLIHARLLTLHQPDCQCENCTPYRPMEMEPQNLSMHGGKRTHSHSDEESSKRRRFDGHLTSDHRQENMVELSDVRCWAGDHEGYGPAQLLPNEPRPSYTSTVTSTSTSTTETTAAPQQHTFQPMSAPLYYEDAMEEVFEVPIPRPEACKDDPPNINNNELPQVPSYTYVPRCNLCQVSHIWEGDHVNGRNTLQECCWLNNLGPSYSDEDGFGITPSLSWDNIDHQRLRCQRRAALHRDEIRAARSVYLHTPSLFAPIHQEPTTMNHNNRAITLVTPSSTPSGNWELIEQLVPHHDDMRVPQPNEPQVPQRNEPQMPQPNEPEVPLPEVPMNPDEQN